MSGIANSDYPYPFFVQNFNFKKLTLFLKKTEIIASFQINLVLSPRRSKTTRKTILSIEKCKQCLYYYKLRQICLNYDCSFFSLQITTKFYKLRQLLQISTKLLQIMQYCKLRQNRRVNYKLGKFTNFKALFQLVSPEYP